MRAPISETACRQSYAKRRRAGRRPARNSSQLPALAAQIEVPQDSACSLKEAALAEAKRRWPAIIILTVRHLDAEFGAAVYFTFPGGKYMAVWFSGTNELMVTSE